MDYRIFNLCVWSFWMPVNTRDFSLIWRTFVESAQNLTPEESTQGRCKVQHIMVTWLTQVVTAHSVAPDFVQLSRASAVILQHCPFPTPFFPPSFKNNLACTLWSHTWNILCIFYLYTEKRRRILVCGVFLLLLFLGGGGLLNWYCPNSFPL